MTEPKEPTNRPSASIKSQVDTINEFLKQFKDAPKEKKQQSAEADQAWKEKADRDAAEIAIARQQAELDKLRNDNQGRKHFSECIFTMMIIWMFLVLMILINTGMDKLNLSDNVLITLLTTTTANVIGLFIIVANYLFNKEKST